MAIPGSLAWVSWRFLITLDRRKHLPAALPSLGRPKQEWWAASSCCVRPERSRSLDDEPCGKDDAGVAASSCIRTDELPATRRDARQISTRRRRRVRAQQQRHGPAARREDFQGDTVHKSDFVALLVTATPSTRRFPDRHAGSSLAARRQHPAHASMLRAGHRGHAGPQLEPQQRLRRVPLLLSRRGDVRRLEAQRHVVLLHKVRRRRGGAQGGPGADLPEQIITTRDAVAGREYARHR